MTSITELRKNLKQQAERITSLAESIESESLREQAQEFVTSTNIALESIKLRYDVSVDIKEDCKGLFDVQNEIFESFKQLGDLLEVSLNESVQRPSMTVYEELVDYIEKAVPRVQEIVEGILKSNTHLTTVSVRSKLEGGKLDESVVADTARLFASAGKYINGAKNVFGAAGTRIAKTNEALKGRINHLKESIVKEDHIKGDYYCVVQPNYAIFGVGKTAEEAWKATEEWADTTDENWKNSFVEKRCSEKVYNTVSQSGTPDEWEEHNGIIVMPEELEELTEAIESAKI